MTAVGAALARLAAATEAIEPPFLALDRSALLANADDLVSRAGGRPVRLASKSIRVRSVLTELLGRPGFAGVMAYSLPEALWLARHGVRDVLLGYPTADRAALCALREDPELAERVTLMVDDIAQLDLIGIGAGTASTIRVCLDVDASLRIGPLHLGVRRSPVHSVDDAVRLAEEVLRRPGLRLVGLMFYEAQIAGLPDTSWPVRVMKRRSAAELLDRRQAVVSAVRKVADLELVNAGGTGSLHVTATDPFITELTAGSGLFAPALFDGYRGFRQKPAMYVVLPVVRRPAARVATLFGGGYVASGPAGRSRSPRPAWPAGLRLTRSEGAGEVQTPVRGAAAAGLAVGDRVWLRHAKAGEVCERFDVVHEVAADGAVRALPTYRGEGKAFG